MGHPTQRGSNSYIRVTCRAHSRMQIPELTFTISDFISLPRAQESVLKDYSAQVWHSKPAGFDVLLPEWRWVLRNPREI